MIDHATTPTPISRRDPVAARMLVVKASLCYPLRRNDAILFGTADIVTRLHAAMRWAITDLPVPPALVEAIHTPRMCVTVVIIVGRLPALMTALRVWIDLVRVEVGAIYLRIQRVEQFEVTPVRPLR
jgi:hypothetical protein